MRRVRDSIDLHHQAVAAVILAGGEGGRLGGAVKANLMLGGKRLVERLAETVGESCDPILISIGRFEIGRIALPEGTLALPDLVVSTRGPLAGLVAAIAYCTALPRPPEFLLSVAVDTPLFPRDFLPRAREAIGEATAIVAASETQDYYTNALWRLAPLSDLPDRAARGTAPRALKHLLASLGAARLVWPGNPFVNINDSTDFERLKRRLAEAGADSDRGRDPR